VFYFAGKIEADLFTKWKNLKTRVQQMKLQVKRSENALTFTFIEVSAQILQVAMTFIEATLALVHKGHKMLKPLLS
jgi:hypothetical protein